MKIAVAIDDNNGVMFNHRRLSKDAELRKRLLKLVGENTLYIAPFSERQFNDEIVSGLYNIKVDENFIDHAGDDDYCFIEDVDVSGHFDLVSEVILYKWNREYPADTYFFFPAEDYEQVSEEDFVGSSHEAITEERFVKPSQKEEIVLELTKK